MTQAVDHARSTMPAPRRLQGKVAVITGAASGMGLAMCQRFAAEGAAIAA